MKVLITKVSRQGLKIVQEVDIPHQAVKNLFSY